MDTGRPGPARCTRPPTARGRSRPPSQRGCRRARTSTRTTWATSAPSRGTRVVAGSGRCSRAARRVTASARRTSGSGRTFHASLSSPGAELLERCVRTLRVAAVVGAQAVRCWATVTPGSISSGRGSGAWGGPSTSRLRCTSDRHWLLAYVPVTKQGSRTFSVAMSALVRAGACTLVRPDNRQLHRDQRRIPVRNAGVRSFTTPGKRGDGTDDWVLVLDSTRAPRCGSITTEGVYFAPKKRPRGVTCEVTASPKEDPSAVVGVHIKFDKA